MSTSTMDRTPPTSGQARGAVTPDLGFVPPIYVSLTPSQPVVLLPLRRAATRLAHHIAHQIKAGA